MNSQYMENITGDSKLIADKQRLATEWLEKLATGPISSAERPRNIKDVPFMKVNKNAKSVQFIED
jgi:hypothetical protein